MTDHELHRRFKHNAPFLELAREINSSTRECREQSLAITSLEEAMFWTNAAIARPEAETQQR